MAILSSFKAATMLGPLSILSLLLAATAALPVAEEGSVPTQSRDIAMQIEKYDFCYLAPGNTCLTKPLKTDGDNDDGHKAGLVIRNEDVEPRSFFVYQNTCECVPFRYITIPANQERFLAFDPLFQGRIVRGTPEVNLNGVPHLLGTWMEFSWDAQGWVWGDVSLIKGCDGAVDVTALDGSGVATGFSTDVLNGAPIGAYKKKGSGAQVIMETENLSNAAIINEVPRNWLASKLGYSKAYIDDHHGNPDICSTNGRFHVNFYPGRP